MIGWVVVLVPAALAIALLLVVRSGTYMWRPSRALLAVLAVALLGFSGLMGAFYLTFGHRGSGGTFDRGSGGTFEPIDVPDSSGHQVNVTVADFTGLVIGVDDASGPPALTGPQTAEIDSGRAVALPIPGSNDLYLRWLAGGCWPAQRLSITGTQEHLAVVVDQAPMASAPCDLAGAWVKLHLRMANNVTDTTVDISRVDE